ncbi:MAG: riboflavin synthase [Alphaproteobacteria bacterium]|nr:riboflavin synthase [Alphaproteobacteria bacterium]
MFTGLVSDVGEIVSVETRGELKRLRIACHYDATSIALGASIACSGPCLTAVAMGQGAGAYPSWFDVDAAAETLARTSVGQWRAGTKVNLERSLKIGDELGGHIVTGHVDGMASVIARRAFDGMVKFDFRAPDALARFIAEKGSVCLDGTSLTVNSVSGAEFSVLLIPHTLAVTTWGERREGDMINLEVDLMARYAARLTQMQS